MPQPWILLPVHNRRELTLGCLRHLEATGAFARFRVLVVDDGSTDGTADAISHAFPTVRIVTGNGQLWWTGAIALGMQEADRGGGNTIIWLNDDCLPEPGSLERLLARAEQNPPTIVGAVCHTDAGTPVASAFTGRVPRTTPPPGAEEIFVDGLSGFCVAVPREVWTAIGFPDPARFPHYFGDNAYTIRARQAGFSVVLCGEAQARLVHYRGRATTVGRYFDQLPVGSQSWAATFASPRSPFRAATQWHYLRLRYGKVAGSALALARLAQWQGAFIAKATGVVRKS